MASYSFPALFEAGDEHEQGYTVTFPDIDGCITEGDTLEEALYMAKDALVGYLYLSERDGDEIPAPSNIDDIKVNSDDLKFIIDVNTDTIALRNEK